MGSTIIREDRRRTGAARPVPVLVRPAFRRPRVSRVAGAVVLDVAEPAVRDADAGLVSAEAPTWMAARMLGAAMVGLENVRREGGAGGVVVDAPGDPPDDRPFDILLDAEHPARNTVVFRAARL